MTQIYQLKIGHAYPVLRHADIARAHDRLAAKGRWGMGGWWCPNNIAAAKRQIREEGFVVRRTCSGAPKR